MWTFKVKQSFLQHVREVWKISGKDRPSRAGSSSATLLPPPNNQPARDYISLVKILILICVVIIFILSDLCSLLRLQSLAWESLAQPGSTNMLHKPIDKPADKDEGGEREEGKTPEIITCTNNVLKTYKVTTFSVIRTSLNIYVCVCVCVCVFVCVKYFLDISLKYK